MYNVRPETDDVIFLLFFFCVDQIGFNVLIRSVEEILVQVHGRG